MKSNPVGWFEIYVQDMPRAKAFYEAVFQGSLTELKNPAADDPSGLEMWAFPSTMDSYGAPGALVRMEGCPSGGSTLVYFSCADCAEEAARATSHGGKVFRPKMSIGEYGFIALVEDTEGNLIGLHSLQSPGDRPRWAADSKRRKHDRRPGTATRTPRPFSGCFR